MGDGAYFQYSYASVQAKVSVKREFLIPLEDGGKVTVRSLRPVVSAMIPAPRLVGRISAKGAIDKEASGSPGYAPPHRVASFLRKVQIGGRLHLNKELNSPP